MSCAADALGRGGCRLRVAVLPFRRQEPVGCSEPCSCCTLLRLHVDPQGNSVLLFKAQKRLPYLPGEIVASSVVFPQT